MDILNNAWTIGIGGGIISGILVFVITNKIFAKKENKEYAQKIQMANKELLYSIRPLIVGQHIPSQDLIDSIIFSTARKYNVKIDDIYENEELAEDLSKEILDNPFLNSESKLKYCELTINLKELGGEEEAESKREVIYIEKAKSISKESISVTLALMTTMTAIVATVFASKSDIVLFENKNSTELITMFFAITSIPIFALLLTRLLKATKAEQRIQKINFENIKKEKETDSEKNE
ncbi:hypothetical protein EMN47_19240 [Prolixibacteraceae bacterium JC049]|nr:hypothetical protein [Prolixibacteraceae bacterium JC049]